LGYGFQAGSGPASQKDQRAFRRKLFGDGGANGASGTENDSGFPLQNAAIHGVLHLS